MKFWTIVQKEFRQFFNTTIAYIFLVVFLGFSGWMYFHVFFIQGEADMRDFFGILPWTFMFLLPAFTMRIWSEEFRGGTIETLFSNGISPLKIIFAKCVSVRLFLILALLLTFPMAFTVAHLGNLDWGQVLVSYLGALILGSAYISIGLAISAMTKNQIVAFLISIILCFFFYIIGQPFVTLFLPTTFGNFFHFIGLGTHYESIMRGVIDSRDIIYYASFIAFFTLINVLVLQYRIQGKRKFWNAFAGVFMIILIGFNVLSSVLWGRYDATEDKRYTLSDISKNIVKNIENPLSIKVFMSDNLPPEIAKKSRDLKDFLDDYQSVSSKLKIEYLDPLKNDEAKTLAQNFGVPPLQLSIIKNDQQQVLKAYLGLAVARENEDKKDATFAEHFEKYETLPILTDLSQFEYDFSAAVKKVSAQEIFKIGYLSGHDENPLTIARANSYTQEVQQNDVPLKEMLEKSYEISNITDLNQEDALKDIKTLLIAAPKKEFSKEETKMLQDYIDKGGNIIFLADRMDIDMSSFAQENKTSFDNFLSYFGLAIKPSLIADASNQQATFSNGGMFSFTLPYPFFVKSVNLSTNSAITKKLESIVFPWTSPIDIENKAGINTEILASTSQYYKEFVGEQLVDVPVEEPEEDISSQDETTSSSNSAENNVESEANHPAAEEITNPEEQTTGITPTSNSKTNDATKEDIKRPTTKKELQLVSISLDPQQKFNITREQKTPLPLAVLASKENGGKLLLIANSRFATRQFLGQSPENVEFLLNAVDSFVIGDDLAFIRSKNITERPIADIPETEKNLFRWLNIILMPFLVIGFGISRKIFRNIKKKNFVVLS